MDGPVGHVSVKMSFGSQFNYVVDGIKWPAGLQHLTFGRRFNQPIKAVVWLASLRYVNVRDCAQPVNPISQMVCLVSEFDVWPSVQSSDRSGRMAGLTKAFDVRHCVEPANSISLMVCLAAEFDVRDRL